VILCHAEEVMKHWSLAASAAACVLLSLGSGAALAAETDGFTTGKPEIRSMSALAFGPPGVLFVGDGRSGSIFAIDLGGRAKPPQEGTKPPEIQDLEGKIAARLGTSPGEIMVHDMAVDPASRRVYLAVSRGRDRWRSAWLLPNDVADATILLEIDATGRIDEVPLDSVRFARAELPNPVDPAKKHEWKKEVDLRADTITDMAFHAGTLWVAGLSNEEFASTMWRFAWPFRPGATATTLENYHGAHGKWETAAPIRTFVPYRLGNTEHVLAAYLCTPFVTFPASDLADGKHVKGRTIAEFGWGNYPLDMIVYRKQGKEKLLIANSNLPFMIVDPAEIERFTGAITAETKTYTAGVAYEPRSGTGVLQLDAFDDTQLLVLRRQPSGQMDLAALPVENF
jgi:hypothetical protein